jgi:hypothetical protein
MKTTVLHVLRAHRHIFLTQVPSTKGKTAREAQEEVKAATAILNAEKKMERMSAGRPAPYYFAPPMSVSPSQPIRLRALPKARML